MHNHRNIQVLSSVALAGALMLGLAGGVSAAEPADAPSVTDEGARFTAVDTTITSEEFPMLQARVVGTNVTLVEGDIIEDLFEDEENITEVVVVIAAPTTGESIVVTTVSGPTWTELASGDWEATFPMPAIGDSFSGSFALGLVGGPAYDPTFTVKNKNVRRPTPK